MLDKIKGGLFDVAIGDASGGTTEFMSEEDINKQYGTVSEIMGGGVWNLEPGEVTDDTAMTLAVAEGILQNPQGPIPQIGMQFLNWYSTDPKDVGHIISRVLDLYNGDWFQAAKQAHVQLGGRSAGNGSLMRCLPVALTYPSIEQIMDITVLQSKMTHYDDLATEACRIYNKIVFRLLNNESIKVVIEQEVSGTKYETALQQTPSVPPDGFVVNTFRWVLYYVYHFESFRDIAIKSANKGGDSDTIAAIACGLKGVEVGYEQLPKHLKDKILVRNKLGTISKDLYQLRSTL